MIIKSLDVAGSTNTLRYAIAKKIPIFNNRHILSFIEPETYYTVTYSDVTMLELFLLVQKYRYKLCIRKEEAPALPDDDELKSLFPGEIQDGNNTIPDHKAVSDAINQFISIFKQMLSDSDIIQDNIAIQFVPMLARRFEISIPISFIDLATSFTSEEALGDFIDATLNDTLNEYIDKDETHTIQHVLSVIFVRNTQIVRYDPNYEILLEAIKYAPLRKVTTNEPYRFKLSSISRVNDKTRVNDSAVLFNTTKDEMNSKMATMSQSKSTIMSEFVVELPVQNMITLMNSFSSEELPITYLSSMKQMIDSIAYIIEFTKKGIVSGKLDLSNPEDPVIQEIMNRLDAYQVRIETAIDILIGTIQKLVEQGTTCDITSIFALLPSIVMSRAVIGINPNNMTKYFYRNQDDVTIIKMFNDIENIVSSLRSQLNG